MINTRFSSWPSYTKEEADAVSKVLLSNKVNYWTGEECRQFEKEFAEWCGCDYGVALANGTVALDVALKALGVGVGDEVIVTPRTFIASVSSIANSGARPVFADVSPESQNITPESVAKVITEKTKAIICVHLAGWPCDMDDMMALAKEHDLYVIEDCAQAHGAQYKGKPVGSFGHIAAWSFCQDKIITTGGEGGMVTTSDRALWSKMWSYKDHGKSWHAVYEQEHSAGFHWLHEQLGTNNRMIEMQAAIGRIQLRRMPQWTKKRQENALQIWKKVRQIKGLVAPIIPEDIGHAAYKCYIQVVPSELKKGWSRDRVMQEIKALGIPCYTGTCPEVYLEKAFDNMDARPKERLPVAKKLGETSLMFLVHPTLAKKEIQQTCDALQQVMEKAVKG